MLVIVLSMIKQQLSSQSASEKERLPSGYFVKYNTYTVGNQNIYKYGLKT